MKTMTSQHANFESLDLMQPLVPSSAHIMELKTTSIADKQNQIDYLIKKRAEILRCIKLINAGIRKRNLPIQISMSLIMIGTAIVMFIDSIKNKNIEQNNSQLAEQKNFLENEVNQLENIAIQLYNNVTINNLSYDCIPQGAFYNNNSYSCDLSLWAYCPPKNWECSSPCYYSDLYTKNCHYDHRKAVNIINPCINLINNYCVVATNVSLFNLKIDEIVEKIDNNFNVLVHEAMGGMAVYYLLTCGLGEVAPLVVIMLTLLTHMFTNYLTSRWFNLSKDDENEILNTANKYDIEDDLTSYPKMLRRFQNVLPELDQKLELYESRLAFCMAQKEVDSKKSPISLLFNSPIREPQLASLIFEMAGKANSSYMSLQRLAFEMGGHIRNAQLSNGGQVNRLFSFFDTLRNQRSNVEKYDFRQGKNSPNEIVRNIYEYAGFVPVAKR